MSDWYLPRQSTAGDGFDVVVRPDGQRWQHTGLLILRLDLGESRTLETGTDEYVIVPLSGRNLRVDGGADSTMLAGRESVFAGPTDVAYIPRNRTFTLTATESTTVALCFAPAASDVPFQVVGTSDVPVEMRGAGNCSRQVHNFGTPDVLQADSIICCEVLTPAGNWSSYPPHKHDEERPGEETELEEIYYFQTRIAPGSPQGAPDGFGVQVVYGTDDRPIEVGVKVGTDDVVLVPHGWHGPSMAPPGYDLYYLNVMAGPGPERAWRICDDPEHSWVRQTWAEQPLDPRLPFVGGADQHDS